MTQTMNWSWDKKFCMGNVAILLILITLLLPTSDGMESGEKANPKIDQQKHIVMLLDKNENFLCNGVAINSKKGFGPTSCVKDAEYAISGAENFGEKGDAAKVNKQTVQNSEETQCADTKNLSVFKLIGPSKVPDGREDKVLSFVGDTPSLADGRAGLLVGFTEGGKEFQKLTAVVSASKDCPPSGKDKYFFCIKAKGGKFSAADHGASFILSGSDKNFYAGMALAGDGETLQVVDLMKYSCWIKKNLAITCSEKVPDNRCTGSYFKPGILVFVLLTWSMMTI